MQLAVSTFSACLLLSAGCTSQHDSDRATATQDGAAGGGAGVLNNGRKANGTGANGNAKPQGGGGTQGSPDASIMPGGGATSTASGGKGPANGGTTGRAGGSSKGGAVGNGGAGISGTGAGGSAGSAGKGGTSSGGSMGIGGAPVNNWTFPLKVSSDSRYVTDATGQPFPLLLDAAWGALSNLTQANFQKYVQDRISKGFDGFEVMAVGRHPRFKNPPFDFAGNLPFTKRLDGSTWDGSLSYGNAATDAPDFTTPNETYWSAVDQKMTYLSSSKMIATLFPAYNGYQGGQEGWMQEMVANGPDKMRTYGAWIANRYKSNPNIVWMLGGDYGAGQYSYNDTQKAVEEAMTNGLESVATVSTQYSNEWSGSSSGSDVKSVSTILFNALTLNAAYSWNPGSRGLYNQCRNSYSFNSPTRPAFVQESMYELNNNGGATAPWRQYSWLGVLNTIGGYTFGNEQVWPFVDGTWQGQLNSLGSKSAAVLNSFVRSIPWWTLIPRGLAGTRVLVTDNAGSTDDDSISGAAAPDGTLAVIYVGPAHSGAFPVDMSVMKGPARARWLDPFLGTYTQIATGIANSGTHSFTTPGNSNGGYGDWVLVIDTP